MKNPTEETRFRAPSDPRKLLRTQRMLEAHRDRLNPSEGALKRAAAGRKGREAGIDLQVSVRANPRTGTGTGPRTGPSKAARIGVLGD